MKKGVFKLNKWYLDLVTDSGEAIICYIANLKWHGIPINYTSIISYHPEAGTHVDSRLSNVVFPVVDPDQISWKDPKFEIEGIWKNNSRVIHERIFESEEGILDWHCYQPSSKVKLTFKNKTYTGKGYVEQLILSIPPWHIPMDYLRWGRYIGNEYNVVWIQLLSHHPKQWLWLNGEKVPDVAIDDKTLTLEQEGLKLEMNQCVVMESETKILSVVKFLIDHIPGINKIIPVKFLMAQETKWLSKSKLLKREDQISTGMSIHELVNFDIQNEE